MSISLVDVPLKEAVVRAREAAAGGQDDAWEALDRHLRWHLVQFLQDRAGNPEELQDALLEACHWAEREAHQTWRICWPYLLELLDDGESQPALAADLQELRAAQGRAAEMLSLLVNEKQPLRSNVVGERLGISTPQQVSNLSKKLEDAGLIVRRQAGGKATWLFPTRRGIQLAKLLPAPSRTERSATKGREISSWAASPWNQVALSRHVSIQ